MSESEDRQTDRQTDRQIANMIQKDLCKGNAALQGAAPPPRRLRLPLVIA